MAVFTIPATRLADAQALVARFARKAGKLGMDAPTLTVDAEFERFWIKRRGSTVAGPFDGSLPVVYLAGRVDVHSVDLVTVEIEGVRPVVAGWRFAAAIEATEGGNLLRKSPHFDADLPERFRDCDATVCDHCKLHRDRASVFVLQHVESGEFKQVGRSCLQDFAGSADPSVWMAAVTFERSFDELAGWDEDGFGGGYAKPSVLSRVFLACVAAHVRELGYLSSTKARESFPPVMSTGDEVFFGLTDRDGNVRARYLDAVTDEDRQLAADALAWVQSDDVGKVSDYIHNVRVLAACESVGSKGANTLASLVPSYRRHLGKLVEKATKLNEHLPSAEPKKRLRRLELTQVREHSFDTIYGTKWILVFEDNAGRTVVWKTTSPGSGYKVGDRVVLDGTVKELTEYNGVMQTELSRCKVTKIEPAAVAA